MSGTLSDEQAAQAQAEVRKLLEDHGIPTDQPLTEGQQLFLDTFLTGNAYIQITRHPDGSYNSRRIDPTTVTLREPA